MSVMVVGGCRYQGTYVVRVLQERQEEIVVVDDLSYGDAARISSARLVPMDVADAGDVGAGRGLGRSHRGDSLRHQVGSR